MHMLSASDRKREITWVIWMNERFGLSHGICFEFLSIKLFSNLLFQSIRPSLQRCAQAHTHARWYDLSRKKKWDFTRRKRNWRLVRACVAWLNAGRCRESQDCHTDALSASNATHSNAFEFSSKYFSSVHLLALFTSLDLSVSATLSCRLFFPRVPLVSFTTVPIVKAYKIHCWWRCRRSKFIKKFYYSPTFVNFSYHAMRSFFISSISVSLQQLLAIFVSVRFYKYLVENRRLCTLHGNESASSTSKINTCSHAMYHEMAVRIGRAFTWYGIEHAHRNAMNCQKRPRLLFFCFLFFGKHQWFSAVIPHHRNGKQFWTIDFYQLMDAIT